MKKLLALLTAVAVMVSMAMTCLAAEEYDIFSVSYGEEFEGPEAEYVEGEVYVSDAAVGASAIYVSGGEYEFNDAFIYGAGYGTEEDLSAERSNQYGYCSDVLAVGNGTVVTLNNPTILSDPESYANGVFATAMAKVYVNGGTIDTNNPQGHGVDAVYMGRVYINDTVIHTAGSSSGSLATDYGGGFIQAENIDCTTELAGSPGIYCAGSSIIICKDSKFAANNCEGVMSAHDHGITVLDNCELYGETSALNGHQAMPSAAQSTGSYCFVFGGTLESGSGPIINEENGRTETFVVGTTCVLGDCEYVIKASDDNEGILTVNVWDTELTGNVYVPAGQSVTINLYDGGKLTGEVEGEGEVVINVYEGGEYAGGFAATEAGAGEAAPELGDFDYYLTTYWAAGNQKWQGSTITTFVESVEPVIAEASAWATVDGETTSIAYDAATTDISENGIDLSALDTSSAAGFGDPGESGGDSAEGESAEDAASEGGESAEEAAEEAGADTSIEAYHAYMYAWLDNECANNDSMTEDQLPEFQACIDADDYETFPGDMFFGGMLNTGIPMTYDEFVAAGGEYTIG